MASSVPGVRVDDRRHYSGHGKEAFAHFIKGDSDIVLHRLQAWHSSPKVVPESAGLF